MHEQQQWCEQHSKLEEVQQHLCGQRTLLDKHKPRNYILSPLSWDYDLHISVVNQDKTITGSLLSS